MPPSMNTIRAERVTRMSEVTEKKRKGRARDAGHAKTLISLTLAKREMRITSYRVTYRVRYAQRASRGMRRAYVRLDYL